MNPCIAFPTEAPHNARVVRMGSTQVQWTYAMAMILDYHSPAPWVGGYANVDTYLTEAQNGCTMWVSSMRAYFTMLYGQCTSQSSTNYPLPQPSTASTAPALCPSPLRQCTSQPSTNYTLSQSSTASRQLGQCTQHIQSSKRAPTTSSPPEHATTNTKSTMDHPLGNAT